MNENTYIALTIGPIYKTFTAVRKTRELWAASYTFSYLSKRIIEELQAKCLVLVPYYEEESPKGIGLYPDRIFIQIKETVTFELGDIESIKDKILKEIAEWHHKDARTLGYLKNYFRVYAVEYTVTESENPVKKGNQLLDTAELRSKWEIKEGENHLLGFFRSVNIIKHDNEKWINNHLDEKDIFAQTRFESLPEIATRAIRMQNIDLYRDLVNKYCYSDSDGDIDNQENSFIKELKAGLNIENQPEIFRNYHKYVCIVKADGDRVGKYINTISSNYVSSFGDLSKALYDWGKRSNNLIRAYSGIPIYIGGDDVLFLAPVVGYDMQTILKLTLEINDSFKGIFKKLPVLKDAKGNDIKPTLSFGISITYYKYPLYEALEKADDLLKEAKKTRNTTCLSLLKHSGSSFDVTLPHDETDQVKIAFDRVNEYFVESKSFVSSIIHHFRLNEQVYRIIGNDADKVENFLLNNFDSKKLKDFVKAVALLCHAIYIKNQGTNDEKASKESIRQLFNMLRISKFLNGKEDGK